MTWVARHEKVAVHEGEAEIAVHVVAHNDAAEGARLVRLERAVALERQEAADVVGRRHGRVDVQVYRESRGELFFLIATLFLAEHSRLTEARRGIKSVSARRRLTARKRWQVWCSQVVVELMLGR